MASRLVQRFLLGSLSWPTDHTTPSVTIGHICVVLRCGLKTIAMFDCHVRHGSSLFWQPLCQNGAFNHCTTEPTLIIVVLQQFAVVSWWCRVAANEGREAAARWRCGGDCRQRDRRPTGRRGTLGTHDGQHVPWIHVHDWPASQGTDLQQLTAVNCIHLIVTVVVTLLLIVILPSLLWHCWLDVRKSIWPVKIEW